MEMKTSISRSCCWLLTTLALLLSSCGDEATPTSHPQPRSIEELRVEHSCWLDSLSLRAILDPDTVPGADCIDTLSAEAWLLVDDATGLVISQRNAHRRMFPASLTKMMTALLCLEHGHLDDTITITREMQTTRDCRVRLGDSYEARHLLSEMMLLSDNVAAVALACHAGGDTLAFAQMMNRKAAYLGMDSTHFANPNGMPNDSNYSTARDLLCLARYAMRDSAFAAIAGTPFADLPLTDGRHMPCQNTNMLLQRYEGCIGVKTGYTRKAGSCLASAATRDGTTLFLVLLKSRSYALRFSESAALLDYGFQVMKRFRQHPICRWLKGFESAVREGTPAASRQPQR